MEFDRVTGVSNQLIKAVLGIAGLDLPVFVYTSYGTLLPALSSSVSLTYTMYDTSPSFIMIAFETLLDV